MELCTGYALEVVGTQFFILLLKQEILVQFFDLPPVHLKEVSFVECGQDRESISQPLLSCCFSRWTLISSSMLS